MTSSSARQICTSVGSAKMTIPLHKRGRSLAPSGLRETALSQKGSCRQCASLKSAMLSTGHRPLFAAYRPSVSLEGSMKDCREAWVILILGYVRSSWPSKQARATYVRNGTHPLDRSAHDVAHSDPVTGNASWILRGHHVAIYRGTLPLLTRDFRYCLRSPAVLGPMKKSRTLWG
jgi:hypothetical protein